MSLELIERHNPAVFEFLRCPVCGHEVFAHIPVEGVFCERCNTSVELREPIEDRGYAEALIACFDTGPTWNLHVQEKLRRDLPKGVGTGQDPRGAGRLRGRLVESQTGRYLGARRTGRVR